MKPIDQTIFHDPENGSIGNCFAACVASILEVDLDLTPNFAEKPTWLADLQEWLRIFGMYYIDFTITGDGRGEAVLDSLGYHILSGDGPRGCRHSVVGYGREIVHDPHPSRAGVTGELQYGVFVPVNPQICLDVCAESVPLADKDKALLDLIATALRVCKTCDCRKSDGRGCWLPWHKDKEFDDEDTCRYWAKSHWTKKE